MIVVPAAARSGNGSVRCDAGPAHTTRLPEISTTPSGSSCPTGHQLSTQNLSTKYHDITCGTTGTSGSAIDNSRSTGVREHVVPLFVRMECVSQESRRWTIGRMGRPLRVVVDEHHARRGGNVPHDLDVLNQSRSGGRILDVDRWRRLQDRHCTDRSRPEDRVREVVSKPLQSFFAIQCVIRTEHDQHHRGFEHFDAVCETRTHIGGSIAAHPGIDKDVVEQGKFTTDALGAVFDVTSMTVGVRQSLSDAVRR